MLPEKTKELINMAERSLEQAWTYDSTASIESAIIYLSKALVIQELAEEEEYKAKRKKDKNG